MNNGTLRTAYSTRNNHEHKWPNAKQIFKQAITYGMAGGLEFETHFTASVWDMSMKENNKTCDTDENNENETICDNAT